MTNPTPLEHLFRYMRAFEVAYLSGDWTVLDAHFCESARHRIEGGRFFFDLAALCEQIGIPVADLSGALRPLRAAGAA